MERYLYVSITGIIFPVAEFEFFVTSWEIKVALKYKKIKIKKIIACYIFDEVENFKPFINKLFKRKAEAKEAVDKASEFFNKRILNSASGKYPDSVIEYFLYFRGSCPNFPYAEFNILLLKNSLALSPASLASALRLKNLLMKGLKFSTSSKI